MQIRLHTPLGIGEYALSKPTTVMGFLHDQSVFLLSPCGGNGTCGKCKVKAWGNLSPMDATEQARLTLEEAAAGIRLACRAVMLGNCEIEITETGSIQAARPTLLRPMADGSISGIGGAIDIGTTTVAVAWYDLTTGNKLAEDCCLNPQISFGSDVVSRLEYAAAEGAEALQKVINETVDRLLENGPGPMKRLVITGNTAMLHFFTGANTSGLTAAPFTPNSLFGETYNSAYLPHCISAFVGADITTAILASNLLFCKSAFLVDIGTNGEMAYKNGDQLICCSTAAGPAFEGAGLSSGMPAIAGAICNVYEETGVLCYKTIGGKPPIGICGSGIIDLLAYMLRRSLLPADGFLEEPFLIGDSGVSITPQDVRQIQLAKAAIAAGIQTLCPNIDSIETFYIAGSFGQYMHLENAATIGLIPKNVLTKTVILGNAALAGASMLLCNPAAKKTEAEIIELAQTVILSQNQEFINLYIENMQFEGFDNQCK